MEPTDKAALGAVSESPGRNASPIKGDVKRHFSPPAGRPRILSCIQPLSPVCNGPGDVDRRRSSRTSSETADSHSQRCHARDRDGALRLLITDKRGGCLGWQPWSYWRLVAYCFLRLSEGA